MEGSLWFILGDGTLFYRKEKERFAQGTVALLDEENETIFEDLEASLLRAIDTRAGPNFAAGGLMVSKWHGWSVWLVWTLLGEIWQSNAGRASFRILWKAARALWKCVGPGYWLRTKILLIYQKALFLMRIYGHWKNCPRKAGGWKQHRS